MLKIVGRITLVFITVLFILGFIRFSINGYQGNFLPSWSEILGWLSSFPNISEELKECTTVLNEPIQGIGDFFETVGAFFVLIWTYISAPFRVLAWFFINFYTPVTV